MVIGIHLIECLLLYSRHYPQRAINIHTDVYTFCIQQKHYIDLQWNHFRCRLMYAKSSVHIGKKRRGGHETVKWWEQCCLLLYPISISMAVRR